MKLIHYSIFRALCAIAVGALLVIYREEMIEWMTVAIGGLFFISGLVAIIVSVSKKNIEVISPTDNIDGAGNTNDEPQQVSKRNGWGWASFVGLGCMVLGLILALMPQTFMHFLVYILSAFLIIGAIQQFCTLAVARKNGKVGFGYWIMPLLLLALGIVALFKPDAIAAAPLFVIGWCMMLYGLFECINALKARSNRKKAEKAFYNLNHKPDFSDAEVVEAEEV